MSKEKEIQKLRLQIDKLKQKINDLENVCEYCEKAKCNAHEEEDIIKKWTDSTPVVTGKGIQRLSDC